MNTVTLLGTEEVSSAARRMVDAANEMSGAAGRIEYALSQHQRFLDEWLTRFETATAEHRPDLVSGETGGSR